MARLCERPGCSNPAEVSYGFDAEHLVVWLDAFGGPMGSRSGVLCLRHANAMVVPLGWMLDDRREPVPRLFRSPVADGTPKRRRTSRAGRHQHDDTEQLLLDPAMVDAITADDDNDDDPVAAETVALTVAETATVAATVAETSTVAEAAAAAETFTEVSIDPPPATDVPVAVDGVQPWQPLFDQQDDLHGLLKTRGSLLSRAFHGTPRST